MLMQNFGVTKNEHCAVCYGIYGVVNPEVTKTATSVFFHTFPECKLDASQRVVTSAVHVKSCCWTTIIS